MAKRSYTKKSSELEELEDDVLIDERLELVPLKTGTVELNLVSQEEPQTTVLVLTKDIGTLNVKGPVSGKLYTFHGAGSKVNIDNEDVEGLLNKINPTGCCPSGSPKQPYFQLIE